MLKGQFNEIFYFKFFMTQFPPSFSKNFRKNLGAWGKMIHEKT